MTPPRPARPLHLLHPTLAERAASFLALRVLAPEPLFIVDTVARRFGEADPDVLLALALVVEAQDRGHVGLDLLRAAERLPVPDERPKAVPDLTEASADPDDDDQRDESEPEAAAWPSDLAAWQASVLASPLVGELGDARRPFAKQALRDGTWLVMSRRMAWEQQQLAAALTRLAQAVPIPALPAAVVEAGVVRLFEKDALDAGPLGEGARACRGAATRSLSVITGGPGTGKTYSIKRLLALLIEAAEPDETARPLRIVLAAPTGKAAVRMTEAMAEELVELETTPAVRKRLMALPASTVHRLLRIRPDGGTRYDHEHPLPADVVVVDEASMLDLILMRKLVDAVAPGARLVLLGDRDQLASVDAGTVLSDIVSGYFDPALGAGPLSGVVSGFTYSHRFKSAPTIGRLAEAIQQQDAGAAEAVDYLMRLRHGEGETDLERVRQLTPTPELGRPSPALLKALAKPYLAHEGYAGKLVALLTSGGMAAVRDGHRDLLDALDGYRVLAVHREGPLGVSGLVRTLGERVRGVLLEAYRKRPYQAGTKPSSDTIERRNKEPLLSRGGHWLGEPVLVTQNAYDVDLRNGDVGLVLPSQVGDHELVAVFPVGAKAERRVREVALPRLPPHMGALAMTVHKAQGSQFKHVAVVLAGRPSPIQTRELVYTAVTRASERLSWVGTEEELLAALRRPIARASGLGPLLWEG